MALGSFDGVHFAHRKLIEEAIALKARVGSDLVGAWCFSDLPANSFTEERVPLICPLKDRIRYLLAIGIDFVAIGDFEDFRTLSAEDFINTVLKDKLHCTGTVCGFNHRFGCNGTGSPEMLEDSFEEGHTSVISEVKYFNYTVSSSNIRECIKNGDMTMARFLLGRHFRLIAPVVNGKRLGRKLGFPTANQYFPKGCIVPKYGIYATVCRLDDGKLYIGVSNVGIRPTIVDGTDSHVANCETYIHNFQGNLYERTLSVAFSHYLRPEMKFDSVEALREQIQKDHRDAVNYYSERLELLDPDF
jgi:riboflavin kinase/FMN adenylyltransferase